MSSISDLLTQAGSGAAAILLDATLKTTVLLLFVAMATRLPRTSSAALRHRLWSLGLGGALLMPLVSLAVPPIRIPLLPPRTAAPSITQEISAATGTVSTAGDVTRSGRVAPRAGLSDGPLLAANSAFPSAATAPGEVALPAVPSAQGGIRLVPVLPRENASSASTMWNRYALLACAIWLAGLLCVLVPLAVGFFARNRVLLRGARQLDDSDWNELLAAVSAQIGLKRPVIAFESAEPIVPMTWGCLRPAIIVPISWRDWSDERRRCVLLHELAHVKRFDVPLQIMGRLAAGVYWFNPLAWYAVRRLQVEREFACDDCVLESGERPTDYARELVGIARFACAPRLVFGAAMVNSDALDHRVSGILDPDRRRQPVTGRLASALFVSAATITFGLAAMNPVERQVAVAAPPEDPGAGLAETRTVADAQGQNSADKVSAGNREAEEKEIDPVKIQGRVVDGDKKPVQGATIRIVQDSPGYGPPPPDVPREVAKTDSSGGFEFTHQVDPFYRTSGMLLLITAEGYGMEWRPLADVLKERTVEVALPGDVPIRGRILTLEGRSVGGATVHVNSIRAMNDENLTPFIGMVKAGDGSNYRFDKRVWDPPEPRDVSTDAEGRFRISGIGRNRVAELRIAGRSIQNGEMQVMTLESAPIEAQKGRGFADFDREMGRPPVFGATFEWVARPSRLIVGMVVDAKTRAPLAGIHVGRTKTDANGRFELSGHAKAKDYYLWASPGDQPYLLASKHVRDTPGFDPIEVTIEMTRGIVVSGRVTDRDTGKPLVAHVDYLPLAPNEHVRRGIGGMEARGVGSFDSGWTNRDGEFSITVLPGPGFIGFTADERDDFRTAHVDVVAFYNKENVPLPNDTSRDWDDDLPVIHSPDSFTGAMPQWNFNAIELLNLPVETDDSTRREIRLVRAIKVAGMVLDPDGQPQGGSTAFGLSNREGDSTVLGTSDFVAGGLGEGETRRLYFRHEAKRLAALATVTAHAKPPLRIKMHPWGEVSGRLLDAEGQPLGNLEIHALEQTIDENADRNLPGNNATDDSGRFRIAGLVPGLTYLVNAHDSQRPGLKIEAKITLKPGEKLDMGDIPGVDESEKP